MAVWQIFALMCVMSCCALVVCAYPGYDNEVHGYEYKHPPQPYGFGYDIKDHHGNQQFRKEHSDGKRVVGSYGYTDAHGVHRLVDYVADEYGFRAKVRTNEPGTANQDPAHVKMISSAYHPGIGDYH